MFGIVFCQVQQLQGSRWDMKGLHLISHGRNNCWPDLTVPGMISPSNTTTGTMGDSNNAALRCDTTLIILRDTTLSVLVPPEPAPSASGGPVSRRGDPQAVHDKGMLQL
jgi:hypothetical protein